MIRRDRPLRVLLCDDEPHMRSMIGQILSTIAECRLYYARDGAEAVALCRAEDPDLVVLDISMPRMDGTEALVELRALKPRMPIIMLSSIVDELVVEKCLAHGATLFFCKDPFGSALRRELGDAIREFFPDQPKNHEQKPTQPGQTPLPG